MRIAEGILAAAAVVLVGAALWLGQPYHYDYPSCEASGVMEKIADGRATSYCACWKAMRKAPMRAPTRPTRPARTNGGNSWAATCLSTAMARLKR